MVVRPFEDIVAGVTKLKVATANFEPKKSL